jgi:hypothetical protein
MQPIGNGPSLSIFSLSEGDDLAPFDRMTLKRFHELYRDWVCAPRQFERGVGSRVPVPVYNVGLLHSSSSFRYAVLVFMAYVNNGRDFDRFGYLAKSYEGVRAAIASNSILEVVYASYMMAVYSLIAEGSMETILVNCHQFCRSLKLLPTFPTIVGNEELLWIETLWQGVLTSLYYGHRDTFFNNFDRLTRLESLQKILHDSTWLLPSRRDIKNLPLSMTSEVICQKITSLSIYMQFYLDHFLFRAAYSGNDEGLEEIDSLRTALKDTVRRIRQLIPHLSNIRDYIHNAYSIPNMQTPSDGPTNDFLHFANLQPRGLKIAANPRPRDTSLALLYTYARLIEKLLDPAADFSTDAATDIYHSAIALCRLCASFGTLRSSTTPMVLLLVKRSLFWAGLVLTKTKFPAGKTPLLTGFNSVAHAWIEDKLQQYVYLDHSAPHCRTLVGEEDIVRQLMEASDRCILFKDIWTIKAGEVALFEYTTILVPSFSCLSLVKFTYAPRHGRMLEII